MLTVLIVIETVVGFVCPMIWLFCRKKIDGEQRAVAWMYSLLAWMITSIIYIIIM